MPRVPYRSQVSLGRLDTPESAPVRTGFQELGRGVSQLGEGISSLEKQYQDEQDSAFLADLKRQYEETYQKTQIEVKGSPRFRGNRVNTKEDAPETFISDNLSKKRQELDALAAKNPRVSKAFKGFADDVDSKGRIFSADWTSAQTFKATADNHDALVNAAIEDVASSTPQDVAVRVQGLIAAVDERSRFLGDDKAVTDQKALSATSTAFQVAIDRQISMNTQSGYKAAQVIFESARSNGYLSASTSAKIENRMRQVGDHFHAQDVADKAFTHILAQNGGIMKGAYNTWERDKAKILDFYKDKPELYAKVEAALNAKHSALVAQDAERFTTMAKTLVSNYENNKRSWTASDIAIMNSWPLELRDKILDFASRTDRPTNPEVQGAILARFDAAIRSGNADEIKKAESMIFGNMNQLSNADRAMLERKASDAQAAIAGKPTTRGQAWDRIRNKIEAKSPDIFKDKTKMAQLENYYYEQVFNQYSAGGKKELTEADLNKMTGDVVGSLSKKIEATSVGWFNKERGKTVTEMEMFEYASGLKPIPSDIVPGPEWIGWGNAPQEQWEALGTRLVFFAKGADAGSGTDRMRMESALNQLSYSKPFAEWKSDWEQTNGRRLTYEQAAAMYSKLAHDVVQEKAKKAEAFDEVLRNDTFWGP